MADIEWLDKYNTGVERIDGPLKKFVEMLNQLSAKVPGGIITKEAPEPLLELSKFAREFFEDEEALMQDIDFPDYTEHKGEHSALRQWFVKKIVEVKGGKKLGTDELSGYLGKWLIDHILKEDKRVGQAATSKTG